MQRYLLPVKHSSVIMLCSCFLLLLNSFFPINSFGIVPRETSYLSGILFAPFLHADWMHLLSNLFPFIILSSLIGLHSLQRFWLVFSLAAICSGTLVWLFARGETIHIGMSGVIYAMWGYLIVYGFKQKQFRDIFIAIGVLVVYGSLVFGVLPSDPNISFESHLFGAIVGALSGYFLSNTNHNK